MKKLLIILSLFMIIFLSSCKNDNKNSETPTQINTKVSNDEWDAWIVNNGLLLIEYKGNNSNIVLPDNINGYNVIGVANGCFSSDLEIESIYVSKYINSFNSNVHNFKTLNHIEVDPDNKYYYADNDCLVETKTKTVVVGSYSGYIPNDIISIGEYAYYDTKDINVILPSSVINLRGFCFGSGLKSIKLNEGLKNIQYKALSDTSIETVNIPSTVEIIDTNSLPIDLTNITVDSNNKIYSVRGNALIKNVSNELIMGFSNSTIDSSVKSIGTNSFKFVTSLKSINIPSTVTEIGDYAFSNTGLENVTLPDEITKFGTGVFNNTKIELIKLPYGVTKITADDFTGCDNLKYVVLPRSVINMQDPFMGCDNLKIIFVYSSKVNYSLTGDLDIYNKASIKFYTDNKDEVDNNSNLWTYYNGHIYTKDLSI